MNVAKLLSRRRELKASVASGRRRLRILQKKLARDTALWESVRDVRLFRGIPIRVTRLPSEGAPVEVSSCGVPKRSAHAAWRDGLWRVSGFDGTGRCEDLGGYASKSAAVRAATAYAAGSYRGGGTR